MKATQEPSGILRCSALHCTISPVFLYNAHGRVTFITNISESVKSVLSPWYARQKESLSAQIIEHRVIKFDGDTVIFGI